MISIGGKLAMPSNAAAKDLLETTDAVAVEGATLIETSCPAFRAVIARQFCSRFDSA